MSEPSPKVRRALLSVSDKDGLVELARALVEHQVELLASGGTHRVLSEAGIPVLKISEFTGANEVLEGRVKTLHPRVHAGILADRRKPEHIAELEREGYAPIDLVVCNLYPFQSVLASGAAHADLVENIDIGGPTLVRAAAKNAEGGVTVVVSPAEYSTVVEAMDMEGTIPSSLRRKLAADAFRHVAAYDIAISAYFDSLDGGQGILPANLPSAARHELLRYGENPHQKGALYRYENEGGVASGTLLAGKALSYNNYLDMDGAFRAAALLASPGCAIVKHTNPCGLAEADRQEDAFRRALEGDPVSAFGGIIGLNTPLEGATAAAIRESKLFVECIVAPGFTQEAREQLEKRENLRLFECSLDAPHPPWSAHRIGGGMLVQETDAGLTDRSEWRVVTKRDVSDEWFDELAFAMRAAMTLKSNAIALCRGRQLLGAGAGFMSRVDAVNQAIAKANGNTARSFLGSDAFFPFPDSIEIAAKSGVIAVIQPGGSKRDEEVIAACDEAGIAMVFSGRRHFRH